jgi:hypothetical protein
MFIRGHTHVSPEPPPTGAGLYGSEKNKTPEEILGRLQNLKNGCSASWWLCFEPAVVLRKDHANKQSGVCEVRCVSCEDDLSIANLSRTVTEHLVNSGDGRWQCKKVPETAAKIAPTGSEAQSDVHDNKTCGNTTAGSNASSDLRDALLPFILPAWRQKLFDEQITEWFISTMTPAQRIEHPAFQAACLHLCATPPSRKDVYKLWLPKLCAEVKERVLASIKRMKMYVIAMDGWKKRVAGGGTHLSTSCCLIPTAAQYSGRWSSMQQVRSRIMSVLCSCFSVWVRK